MTLRPPTRRLSVGRSLSLFSFDAFAWVLALSIALVVRYEFVWSSISWDGLLLAVALAASAQFLTGSLFGLYQGRFAPGSFHEVRSLVWSVTITAVGLTGAILLSHAFALMPLALVPRTSGVLALPFAVLLLSSVRYVRRLLIENRQRPNATEKALVFGAGYVGASLVRRMRTDVLSPYQAVGLLDDDPLKARMQHYGVPVLGALADLGAAAERTGASVVIVAIAKADSKLLNRVSLAADEAGLRVVVTPSVGEVLGGRESVGDLYELTIEDLIGRRQFDTDVETIAKYLQGKTVLVTGAGGSIGAELCRRVAKFAPLRLYMLDRDETALQDVHMSLPHGEIEGPYEVVLADIRDADGMVEVFAGIKPNVVFHAAALKHLPILERYPLEAWKTNVLGTHNTLEAARAAGVETFINISTDKAANPSNILGHSKRVAERLTSWFAHETGRRYLSVRFGNVLGSRGSVVPVFRDMIASGGPIAVTHPDVTRYFMTIPEACQLVVQAGGIGAPGEVLILDMGEPVPILSIARRMIEMSGKDIEIAYTGLRKGEKLHEDLTGDGEEVERRVHPMISHAQTTAIDPSRLSYSTFADRAGVEHEQA